MKDQGMKEQAVPGVGANGPSGALSGTAVVTGGAGGIGRALLAALAARGAATAALDLAADPEGPADLALSCDVRDPDAVREAVERAAAELGPVRYLVCAAGVVSEAPVAELAPEEFRRVVDISLFGTFHALRAVLPGMAARGAGSVVALSTGWATKGYPRGSHYAAAKAGVEALVKSAALEVAGTGVRLNAVAPGPVETPMLTSFPDYHDRAAARAAAVPMGRVGLPEDVVGPVLFLLGESSAYMTGQVVHVNGGLLMP